MFVWLERVVRRCTGVQWDEEFCTFVTSSRSKNEFDSIFHWNFWVSSPSLKFFHICLLLSVVIFPSLCKGDETSDAFKLRMCFWFRNYHLLTYEASHFVLLVVPLRSLLYNCCHEFCDWRRMRWPSIVDVLWEVRAVCQLVHALSWLHLCLVPANSTLCSMFCPIRSIQWKRLNTGNLGHVVALRSFFNAVRWSNWDASGHDWLKLG